MNVPRIRHQRFGVEDVLPARVINEDKDYMLLEVAKRPGVTFHLDDNAEQNRFYTIIFTDGIPWEKESSR